MRRLSFLWGALCVTVLVPSARAGMLFAVGSGVGDRSSNLYRIDNYATSPAAVNIGETGHIMFDLAIDPTTDRFYAIDDSRQLFELNPLTGQATLIGNTGISGSQNALAFDASGQLFSWGRLDSQLYKLDKTNAAATPVGSTSYFAAGALAMNAGGQLFGSTTGSDLIRIDPASGNGTLVGPLGLVALGLAFDAGLTLYAGEGGDMSNLANLWTVNTSNGVPTFIGNVAGAGNFGLGGLAFQVPEPAALGSLAVGAAIAAMALRRRRTAWSRIAPRKRGC